jgi:DNA-binding transcriptional ArsR family regulator
MPLEIIENTEDPIAAMISFDTSPVYEMMISLQLLIESPRRHREWAEAIKSQVSPGFINELEAIYRPFWLGGIFFELAVDYQDHQNVEGFIEYVRGMSTEEFLFYVFGRVITIEEIQALDNLSLENITKLLYRLNFDYAQKCLEMPYDNILRDVHGFKKRLAGLWQHYWQNIFEEEVETFREQWETAIIDRERLLEREGGQKLLEVLLTKFKDLPPEIPSGMPYTEIKMIPISRLRSQTYMFFGYGSITILFSGDLTEARVAEIEDAKEKALTVLRALSDPSRLSILRMVTRHHGKIHGKKLAEILDLSPSVVSRHLSQLKDSGLLVEEPQDNRTIYYTLQEEAITSLPASLLDYIYS